VPAFPLGSTWPDLHILTCPHLTPAPTTAASPHPQELLDTFGTLPWTGGTLEEQPWQQQQPWVQHHMELGCGATQGGGQGQAGCSLRCSGMATRLGRQLPGVMERRHAKSGVHWSRLCMPDLWGTGCGWSDAKQGMAVG